MIKNISHHHKNIVLDQIVVDNSSYSFKEIVPKFVYSDSNQVLARDHDGNIFWIDIDLSLNVVINNRIKDTDIYYTDGRVGLSRYPLFNYRVDVAVPKNTIMTAFHIGDGSFGFSMGNGTSRGFVPEIIGIGSDERDAGLYFVGIAGNDNPSHVPLILIDGRDTYNDKLVNRPIFGITSANYNEYSVCVDASENLKVRGNICAADLLFNDNISLIKIIMDLQQQINDLKIKIT
jgi:hypothetical protein